MADYEKQVLKLLKDFKIELFKELEDMKKEIKADTNNAIEIVRTNFERKIDIIANIEKSNEVINRKEATTKKTATSSKSQSSSSQLTPLIFLQNKFKENVEEYVDILYSIDEINISMRSSELLKHKKGTVIYGKKLASIVYNSYIKSDKKKLLKLTQLKDDSINCLENATEEISENLEDVEEIKDIVDDGDADME